MKKQNSPKYSYQLVGVFCPIQSNFFQRGELHVILFSFCLIQYKFFVDHTTSLAETHLDCVGQKTDNQNLQARIKVYWSCYCFSRRTHFVQIKNKKLQFLQDVAQLLCDGAPTHRRQLLLHRYRKYAARVIMLPFFPETPGFNNLVMGKFTFKNKGKIRE